MTASVINAVLLALLALLPSAGSSRGEGDLKKEVVDKKVVVTLGDEDIDVDGDDPVVVHVGRRGFLGVRLLEITPELPAKAGLEVGDVITSVDGERVGWTGDVSRAIGRKNGGETVQIDLVRGRASRKLTVTIEERKGHERSIDFGDLGDHLRRRAWVMRDLDKAHPLLGDFEDLSRMRKRMEDLEKRMSDLEKRLGSGLHLPH